jgi:fatty-acyl-CoA synthase
VHEYLSCIHAGDYDATDVTVHALPLFHCAQLHCFLTPQLFLGSRNIILDSADAATIIATIAQNNATSFFAPPTVWIAILNHPSFRPEALRSLKKGYYGASIMPAEVLRAIRAALPWLRVWNFYGQTEIGPLASVLLPEEHDARPTSAGRPALFVESRVVDDDMRDVGPGEIGELVHRSPQLLAGYYRDPEKTAEAFRGGWFHSGDLATMDAQGYLKIVDRKKDMIKSGGENVASREVEEVIYQHQAVAEVAVFGLPDPKWVERVCAAVVLRQGAAATADDIIEWTAKSLAPFKRPKQVVFCEALPKNASGKILKKNLRVSIMVEP